MMEHMTKGMVAATKPLSRNAFRVWREEVFGEASCARWKRPASDSTGYITCATRATIQEIAVRLSRHSKMWQAVHLSIGLLPVDIQFSILYNAPILSLATAGPLAAVQTTHGLDCDLVG
jgi:hypothetical protein